MTEYHYPGSEQYLTQLVPCSFPYKSMVDIQKPGSNYLSITPPNRYSIDSILPSKPDHKNDIVNTFVNDKLSMNKANISLLRQLVNDRTKIREDNIYSIEYKIMQCRNYIIALETWPTLSNSMVEGKRANLGQTITKLESERGMEFSRCWNDQVRLYQEILKAVGEYKSSVRKTKLLSGEIK